MSAPVIQAHETLDPRLRALLEQQPQQAKDFIYCATCSAVIARRNDGIEINGSHDHRCTNPYGLVFHIGCFREALGCGIVGPAVPADSWFMGFQWRIAACGECQRHLGWYFERVSPGTDGGFFYGLILDRIQYE